MQQELFQRPTGLEFLRGMTDTWLRNHSQAVEAKLAEYKPGYTPKINNKTGRPFKTGCLPWMVPKWTQALEQMKQVIAEREQLKTSDPCQK